MTLQCKTFMSDYETALRNGFAAVVPDANLASCWFHFVQAVKRNAVKLPNLVKLIRSNPAAGNIYYKLQSLPLLPAKHIVPAFNMLKSEAYSLNKGLFARFFKYYENQWLKRVRVSYFFYFVLPFDCIHFLMYFDLNYSILGGTQPNFCI